MIAAALAVLRGLGGGFLDLFHRLLPPERLQRLMTCAGVAVIAWLACFVHYDVRGLKNDRIAYRALQKQVAAAHLEANSREAAARRAGYSAGLDAAKSFQRTADILTPIIREVPIHVTAKDDAACPVPWGFVRLWDAIATGADLDAVRARVAPGQPDDARSDVALSEIVALYGTAATRAHQNADQLNRLVAFENEAAAIAGAPPP